MTHLFVATPAYGGQCSILYTKSMMSLQKQLNEAGINMTFGCLANESLITRARNAMAHAFLKTECTHLFFIDSDIYFRPEDVQPMIAADKSIICGIYPKKEINWNAVARAFENKIPTDQLRYHSGSFVVNLVDYSGSVTVPVGEPVEIWNGGTGFMLIKREVFELLESKVKTYTNNVGDTGGTLKADPIREFFYTCIEEETNVLLSEDYAFCRLARDNGIKVYAAPWAELSHIGTYTFDGRLTPAP